MKTLILILFLTLRVFGQNELFFLMSGDKPPTPLLTATGAIAKVTLSGYTTAGATSYYIYRGTSINPTTAIDTITATTYVDSPLTVATIYFYRIKAVNGNGVSDYSSNASDTAGIYGGTELVTNQIDRDFEVGSNTITNGTFDKDSNWTKQSGWTISGLKANFDGTANNVYLLQSNVVVAGNRYAINVDASNFAGAGSNPYVQISGGSNGAITADGNFKFNATASITNILLRGFLTRSFSLDNVSVSRISAFITNGNHSIDSSSSFKAGGTYSGKIITTGAGNGTTNTISFASTLFTAVTNGSYYRFQLYAYTTTANTTLTFKLGDIVLTAIISTVGMNVINFDFKATASTTGDILLYLDKAATVYIDQVSLKPAS